MMHIVLRGSLSFKTAGYKIFTLKKGDAVVHPVKYYLRLIPVHGYMSSDVMTIVL